MQQYIARRFQGSQSGLSLDTGALRRYPDVIDLSIGDTDIITDPRVIDAACADAHAGYTRYGDPKGDPELIDAICEAWREDYHQAVSPEEVLITTSSCMGMSQVMLGLLNPGDEALVFGADKYPESSSPDVEVCLIDADELGASEAESQYIASLIEQ